MRKLFVAAGYNCDFLTRIIHGITWVLPFFILGMLLGKSLLFQQISIGLTVGAMTLGAVAYYRHEALCYPRKHKL